MKVRKGYKYQLAETHTIQTPIVTGKDINTDWYSLSATGVLTLNKGYAWDGATGVPDWDEVMSPSAEHDAFCQMMRNEELSYTFWQNQVNQFFKERLIQNGIWSFRAWYWHRGVEIADCGNPNQGISNPIFEVP
jgi:hypothetical protein